MAKSVVLLRSNPVCPDPPVEKIAKVLLETGFSVTIVAWDRDDEYRQRCDDLVLSGGVAKIIRFGIPAVYGGGLRKSAAAQISFQRNLYRWLQQHRSEYDVIHAFDFDTGFIASKVAEKYKKQFVYHILDFYADSHSLGTGVVAKTVKATELEIVNHADATIVCSEARKEQIVGSQPKALTVIHNTPDDGLVSPDLRGFKSASDKVKIAYVGTLSSSRLILELLDIVKCDVRLELHIGGFGFLEEEVIAAEAACDRIFWYGRLPYARVLALENDCDIMTVLYDPDVSNHKYAAPNKFYEALMLGKPIVAARGTAIDEIVQRESLGVVIDFSKEGLGEGIDRLIRAKKEWSNMGCRARALYTNAYSWKSMRERVIALYALLEK